MGLTPSMVGWRVFSKNNRLSRRSKTLGQFASEGCCFQEENSMNVPTKRTSNSMTKSVYPTYTLLDKDFKLDMFSTRRDDLLYT